MELNVVFVRFAEEARQRFAREIGRLRLHGVSLQRNTHTVPNSLVVSVLRQIDYTSERSWVRSQLGAASFPDEMLVQIEVSIFRTVNNDEQQHSNISHTTTHSYGHWWVGCHQPTKRVHELYVQKMGKRVINRLHAGLPIHPRKRRSGEWRKNTHTHTYAFRTRLTACTRINGIFPEYSTLKNVIWLRPWAKRGVDLLSHCSVRS